MGPRYEASESLDPAAFSLYIRWQLTLYSGHGGVDVKFNFERMRRARLQLGMSQEQLAVFLHVSRSTIERWEWGQTEPTASKLAQIAMRLKRDPGYFLRKDRVSA